MESLKLLSPSKVNLTLRITGRRADGYHYIHSVFQPINLFDEIEIYAENGSGIELDVTGAEIPRIEENIVVRATEDYLDQSELDYKIRISLKKNIPVGGGLGGGSGNGAAVLVGLNKIFKRLNDEQLNQLAIKLGSDVPFFIRSVTSLVEGVGDKINLLNDFPLFHYVLLFPKVHVSTKDVYEKWDEETSSADKTPEIDELIGQFRDGDDLPLFNTLEGPALKLFPELEKYREIISSMGVRNVLMTGSGSTFVGVFRESDEAKEVYDYLNVSDEFQVFRAEGIKGWNYLVE